MLIVLDFIKLFLDLEELLLMLQVKAQFAVRHQYIFFGFFGPFWDFPEFSDP